MVAIYHRIFRRENFETAANDLIRLLYMTQEKEPNKPRALYVDIEGHKNEAGGFDEDMRELQTEFGMGVLLQFVEELHFPLVSVKNIKGQRNDIPRKIMISNQKNEKNTSLEQLYIENYSNTEFLTEPDVYEYMSELSVFLRNYSENIMYVCKKEEYDSFGWLEMWKKYISELYNELFNSFILGNLISVAAMTRTLIESYVYICILKREESQELIDEWWLCNMIHKVKDFNEKDNPLVEVIKDYCKIHDIDFEEKWNYYITKAKREGGWLRKLMGEKGVGFHVLCEYIEEGEIYKDYQSASAFVHGQDVVTKCSPFAFYPSIYNRLYLMVHYIFKTIRLFDVDDDTIDIMFDLEKRILELGEKYLK